MADLLTFYQSKPEDEWRWRYQAEGNYEPMANGGESYHSLEACTESAFRVCGIEQRPETEVILASGLTLARPNAMSVQVEIEESD